MKRWFLCFIGLHFWNYRPLVDLQYLRTCVFCHIEQVKSAQQGVQRIGLLARIGQWLDNIANP